MGSEEDRMGYGTVGQSIDLEKKIFGTANERMSKSRRGCVTKMLGEMDSEAFQQWPPSLQFTKDWSYTQFVDIIVFCIARLFNPKVKRISEEMKQALQKEPVGDWFLRKEYSMMRIYGFTASPYILPVFLTPTIFSLELIRQRIHADIEHFTSHKKKFLDKVSN